MTNNEILNTFIYESPAGAFVTINPVEQDSIIGYYDTKDEAVRALEQFIDEEKIIFE